MACIVVLNVFYGSGGGSVYGKISAGNTHGQRLSLFYGLSFLDNYFTGIAAVLFNRHHQNIWQRHGCNCKTACVFILIRMNSAVEMPQVTSLDFS